ncbi:unnamed protein product [Nesidiocoris tenuis]|uniref:Uncharacterized protein n=1 Tax=Nesidiocoris tenuis TaxID=355587 RepID=A0A6H5HLQ5_9HEMI|nr:unnamed protein product [Nesidiocoris tenuis]
MAAITFQVKKAFHKTHTPSSGGGAFRFCRPMLEHSHSFDLRGFLPNSDRIHYPIDPLVWRRKPVKVPRIADSDGLRMPTAESLPWKSAPPVGMEINKLLIHGLSQVESGVQTLLSVRPVGFASRGVRVITAVTKRQVTSSIPGYVTASVKSEGFWSSVLGLASSGGQTKTELIRRIRGSKLNSKNCILLRETGTLRLREGYLPSQEFLVRLQTVSSRLTVRSNNLSSKEKIPLVEQWWSKDQNFFKMKTEFAVGETLKDLKFDHTVGTVRVGRKTNTERPVQTSAGRGGGLGIAPCTRRLKIVA